MIELSWLIFSYDFNATDFKSIVMESINRTHRNFQVIVWKTPKFLVPNVVRVCSAVLKDVVKQPIVSGRFTKEARTVLNIKSDDLYQAQVPIFCNQFGLF